MTQHPKLGVKPDALSVVRCRVYHGHYYIEGAPFRISFWTYGADIDADEAQRRLDFANELVAAWNAREAAEAKAKAREAMLRDIVNEAAFLIDRLRDLDWSQDYDDFANSYSGHVDPSESRLRGLIADYRALTKEPDA